MSQTHTLQPSSIRFPVQPRLVPAIKAAYFADLPPADITLELLDDWYGRLLRVKGVDIAYRAVKTWRSLYNVMAGMKLCPPGSDPSQAIRRQTPPPRHQTWTAGEAGRLARRLPRTGLHHRRCVGHELLTRRRVHAHTGAGNADSTGMGFSDCTQQEWRGGFRHAVVTHAAPGAGLCRILGVTLLDDAPIFRSRGFAPGPKGGRPRAGVPYTKDSLVDEFADLRTLVFGTSEKRRLMDMRRSGAVEAMPEARRSRQSRPRWAIRSTGTRRCRRPICRSIWPPSAQPMPAAARAESCLAWNGTNTES